MFEPVTFAIAFIVVMVIYIYRRERRFNRLNEFDGGWRHENNVKGEDH